MVRPREFNEQTAIDQALIIFCKQGYKGSSLQDLIRAMGISKSSFYETFGSKHEFFLNILRRFHETSAIYNFVDPNFTRPAKIIIMNLFRCIIDSIMDGKGGCLFGNCAVEFSDTNPQVTAEIAHGVKQLEQTFSDILKYGQKNAEIPKRLNVQTTARQLIVTFYGLQVMANTGLTREALNEIAANAITILD